MPRLLFLSWTQQVLIITAGSSSLGVIQRVWPSMQRTISIMEPHMQWIPMPYSAGMRIRSGKLLKIPKVLFSSDQMEKSSPICRVGLMIAKWMMAAMYSSGADTYPEVTKAALLEMHRQVGVAKPAADGLMYRGLMIRHLVMPNDVGGSKEVMSWIAENLPLDTYVNIMSQYRPMYKASEYRQIDRPINRREYREVVEHARGLGLTNLDIQGMSLF